MKLRAIMAGLIAIPASAGLNPVRDAEFHETVEVRAQVGSDDLEGDSRAPGSVRGSSAT